MFGILNDSEIEELLAHQIVGRIGCHADGVTYIVPISYMYDGTHVYCHTVEGMKVDFLRKNPSLCFQLDNTKDLANWKSVIGWGEFEELKEPGEKRLAMEKLNQRKFPVISSDTMHLSDDWPFSPEKGEDMVGIFFRIKLTKKTGRFERRKDSFFFAT